MLPILADQDVSRIIIDGLIAYYPAANVILARDVGLSEVSDDEVLEWAAKNDRLVVSHDKRTMTTAAYDRMRERNKMLGLVIVPQSLSYRIAIEHLALVACCSDLYEWRDIVRYLPLP